MNDTMPVRVDGRTELRRIDHVVVVDGALVSHCVPETQEGEIVAHTLDGQCMVFRDSAPPRAQSAPNEIHCHGSQGHWVWKPAA